MRFEDYCQEGFLEPIPASPTEMNEMSILSFSVSISCTAWLDSMIVENIFKKSRTRTQSLNHLNSSPDLCCRINNLNWMLDSRWSLVDFNLPPAPCMPIFNMISPTPWFPDSLAYLLPDSLIPWLGWPRIIGIYSDCNMWSTFLSPNLAPSYPHI